MTTTNDVDWPKVPKVAAHRGERPRPCIHCGDLTNEHIVGSLDGGAVWAECDQCLNERHTTRTPTEASDLEAQ